MSELLINLWDRITVYCLNHENPEEMQIMQNMEKIKSPFYACGTYQSTKCPNRMNLDDYQGIVLKFADIVSSEGMATDFTNYSFNYRGNRHKLFVRVLKYTDKEIRLGIKNCTILGV